VIFQKKSLIGDSAQRFQPGAPIPEGANGVVMVEFTNKSDGDILLLKVQLSDRT